MSETSDNSTPTGLEAKEDRWELLAPDDQTLELAKRVVQALESAQRRVGLADEAILDADQMTGWFVRKKRFRVIERAQALKEASERELEDISDKTINYATTSYDCARAMEKALSWLALNGIPDSVTSEQVKPSKATTLSIEGINQALDSFAKSYSKARAPRGLLGEAPEGGAPSGAAPEGAEGEAIQEAPEAPGDGEGGPHELLGNREQALDTLERTLASFAASAGEKESELKVIIAATGRHHSQAYLERKRLNASVSETVGSLERSLTESRLHHNRLERNIVELSGRVSETLDRLQGEMKSSIRDLEESGNQKLENLHETVKGHKAEYGGKLDTLSSDYSSLKGSLDESSKNYEDLANGLKELTGKLSELEARNQESNEALQQGLDELKGKLDKAPEKEAGGEGHKKALLIAWGAFVTLVAIAAFIAALH